MKTLFVAFLLLGTSFLYAQAQEIKVIDYAGLEAYMEQQTPEKLYVYNFWATWCGPCVKELPYFTRLDSAYEAQQVEVVFVSLDFPDLLDRAVKPMVAKKLPGQEVLLLDDPKQQVWIPKIDPEWGGAIPATLVMGNSQNIRAFKSQSFTYEEISEWIESFLTP